MDRMDPAARVRSRGHRRLPSPACLLGSGSPEKGHQAEGGRPAAVTHDQYGENLDGVCRYPKPTKASPLPQVAFKRY